MVRPHAMRHNGITVGDVMTKSVIKVAPDTSVWEAASIMERRGVKRLPVVDPEQDLIGIVSRADLVKAMARDDAQIARDVREMIDTFVGSENIRLLDVHVVHGTAVIAGVADRTSTRNLTVRLVGRLPGVVKVVDQMSSLLDDAHLDHARAEIDPKDPRLDWRREEAVNRGSR
jgi:CBS domain-containing protein